MPSYTLEIEALGVYSSDIPTLEVWAEGALDSSYAINSAGTSISVVINYGGSLPTSLEFRFNDALPEGGRTIEIQSVKINDKYVNVGNYLSRDSLTNGGAASVVDVAGSDFIFDASEPVAGDFLPATQTFTTGADTFRDTNGTTDQAFDMLAGRDVAYLGSGNDAVNGGAGDDIIRGGGGNDLLYGEGDSDRLFGEDGDDTIYGGDGNDWLYGNDGNDELHGGAGNDRIFGHAGDDVMTGGLGDDVLLGGNGNNYIYGDAGNDRLSGGNDVDTLDGGDDDDIIYGGGGDDFLNGGNGNDVLVGNTGADIINGDDGDDIIYVMTNDFAAGEAIYGGAGTDELVLTHASTVDFTTGIIDGIETLTGSNGDQNVTMSILQFFSFTTIDYGGGTDSQTVSIAGTYDVTSLTAPTVSNLESASLIFSNGIDDLTISGTQLDAFTTGASTFNTLGGNDILNITSTSVNLNAYGSNDGSLLGLENISASGAATDTFITMSGQSEAFTITGSSFNDTLTGGSAADTINGGDGDDILTGLTGTDIINGGNGNDTILGGDGDDTLNGGDGDDTIYGATIIGESGVVTGSTASSTSWNTVTFSSTILNPVVKMSALSTNSDPFSVRVRNVTETGFEWQIDEWDYLDGVSATETLSWLAVEAGTHTLDNGVTIQAGTVSVTNGNFSNVTFGSAFSSTPIVVSQVMSYNDTDAANNRNRNVTTTGFQTRLQEEKAGDDVHGTETMGWIAIEQSGSPASGFYVSETAQVVTHNNTNISFPTSFSNTPVFVHDMQTFSGGDPSYSAANNITTSGATVYVQEEASNGSNNNHPAQERIGYFALNEGLLTAANGGDNTFRGGAGVDTLFGGDGMDIFIFEAANAYADNDILADFSAGEGDALDISDLIIGAFSGSITDYVFFDDSSGTDTVVQVDGNGLTGGSNFQAIATINGITGLDENTLYSNGNIIV
jgi:Ca2+-binding RTX toxin-like protein